MHKFSGGRQHIIIKRDDTASDLSKAKKTAEQNDKSMSFSYFLRSGLDDAKALLATLDPQKAGLVPGGSSGREGKKK